LTIHLLEVPVGSPSKAPALAKHAVRFCRRLRARGILNFEAPSILDDSRHVIKVRVGRRMVNIFDDGTYTASLMRPPTYLFPKGRFDYAAFSAQSNRMHAIYLAQAAHARKCGLKFAARADLTTAIQERLHHERAC